MTLKELKEARFKLYTEMCEHNDAVEARDGQYTAEEEEKWQKMQTAINDYDERIEKAESLEGREKELSEPTSERADANLEDVEDREEVRDADWQFRDFLRRGENRALQADLDVDGGFTVAPETFASGIIMDLDNEVYMRGLATTLTLDKADSLSGISFDTDVEDATWQAEITSADEETAAKFGKRSLTPHKGAKLIKISMDLVDDSSIDIAGFIRGRFAYKFGVTEENCFINGTGQMQPLGFMVASADGINTDRDLATGNSTSEIVADNLIRQQGNVKAGYLRNARWMFHRDAVNQIRRLVDGNGQYLLVPGLANGPASTILGIPYIQSEYMPNTFETGLYVGILGDFSYYWIATKKTFAIQMLSELYARTHQYGYIGRMRVDGMPVLSNAFTRVTLG